MPTFTDQFAACVQRQQGLLRARFSGEPASPLEAVLKRELATRWLPFPQQEMRKLPTYAADGSEAVRHFNNGLTLVIAQALLVGPNTEAPLLEAHFVPRTLPDPVLNRYRGLLMRALEVRVALNHARQSRDSILCMDGSLQTPLPHLLYPLKEIPEERDLPLRVLRNYLELFEVCQANRILLLGISKTTGASFLTEALLRLREGLEEMPVDAAEQAGELPLLPSDAETLFRWSESPGFSHPLLLGVHAFGHRWRQVIQGAARAGSDGGEDPGADLSASHEVMARLAALPAVAAFHVRQRIGEEPMRVDVPASCLDLPHRIGDFYFRWAPLDALEPALRQVRAGYGGASVYHSALYVADRLVRLNQNLVDGPFLSIIRNAVGQYVQYDRSRRRFV